MVAVFTVAGAKLNLSLQVNPWDVSTMFVLKSFVNFKLDINSFPVSWYFIQIKYLRGHFFDVLIMLDLTRHDNSFLSVG